MYGQDTDHLFEMAVVRISNVFLLLTTVPSLYFWSIAAIFLLTACSHHHLWVGSPSQTSLSLTSLNQDKPLIICILILVLLLLLLSLLDCCLAREGRTGLSQTTDLTFQDGIYWTSNSSRKESSTWVRDFLLLLSTVTS